MWFPRRPARPAAAQEPLTFAASNPSLTGSPLTRLRGQPGGTIAVRTLLRVEPGAGSRLLVLASRRRLATRSSPQHAGKDHHRRGARDYPRRVGPGHDHGGPRILRRLPERQTRPRLAAIDLGFQSLTADGRRSENFSDASRAGSAELLWRDSRTVLPCRQRLRSALRYGAIG